MRGSVAAVRRLIDCCLSPAGFLLAAAAVLAVSIPTELAGWRRHTAFLSGSGAISVEGLLFMASHYTEYFLVPPLAIGGALFTLLLYARRPAEQPGGLAQKWGAGALAVLVLAFPFIARMAYQFLPALLKALYPQMDPPKFMLYVLLPRIVTLTLPWLVALPLAALSLAFAVRDAVRYPGALKPWLWLAIAGLLCLPGGFILLALLWMAKSLL